MPKPIALLIALLTGLVTAAQPFEPTDALTAAKPTVSIDSINYEQSDASSITSNKFNAKQLILPGAMMAVGVAGVYVSGLKSINKHVQHGMDNLRGSHYFHADDYVQYLPAAAYLGAEYLGARSRHGIRERLLAGATAYVAMAAITNVAKVAFKEKRPDSGKRNSFPSGHTATAFTGAELMRLEYGLGPAIAAYGVATGVAFLRLYNGRHWLNDVIAGAGVGILSARIGYWMLPLYQRWFHLDNKRVGTSFAPVPSYDPSTRTVSLSLAARF